LLRDIGMRSGTKYNNRLLAALLGGALMLSTSVLAASAPQLADAAQKQDKAAVRTLLQNKADVNAAQPDGATALHWASIGTIRKRSIC
jgi:ankyrin repeat protein